jgi:hypothetical protein
MDKLTLTNALQAENARLKKALRFYAEPDNYEPQPLHPLHPNSWMCPVEVDQGKLARKELFMEEYDVEVSD